MATESSSRSSVPIAQHNIDDDSRSTYNSNRSYVSRGSIRKINFEDLTCPCGEIEDAFLHHYWQPWETDGCNFFQWEDDFARNLRYFHLKHIKPHIPGGMGDVVEAAVEAKHVEDDGQNKKIMRLRTKLEDERKKSHFLLVCLVLSIGVLFGLMLFVDKLEPSRDWSIVKDINHRGLGVP
ncbi:hypothetical protein RIF29_01923 [Crotalaria pallida]|uniref:Uncharacterized protein n=1 Tax=Crotalaria pallida TaxID=3830 RepID=A0AAN9IZ51_CROPI